MAVFFSQCFSKDLSIRSRPTPHFSGDYGMEVRWGPRRLARHGANALRMMKGVAISPAATEESVGSWECCS